MSSRSLLERLASNADQQTAVFVQDRCLRKRLNTFDCQRCIDICAAGALSLRDRSISFDPGACTGCMLCTTACPNDAFCFSGFDGGSPSFLKQTSELTVISCPRQSRLYQEERRIPCLGGITIEQLLALALESAGGAVIAFNISSCTDCENSYGVRRFLARLAWVEEKAGSLFKRECIVITEKKQFKSLELSVRRLFLSNLKDNLLITIGSPFSFSLDGPNQTARTSRRIPARVRLKKNLLEHLEPNHKESVSALIDHQLAVGSACNLCPLCTGICPTGAVRVDRIDGQKRLTFNTMLCSGCGLCVSFCKKNALSLEYPVSGAMQADMGSESPLPETALQVVEQPVDGYMRR